MVPDGVMSLLQSSRVKPEPPEVGHCKARADVVYMCSKYIEVHGPEVFQKLNMNITCPHKTELKKM